MIFIILCCIKPIHSPNKAPYLYRKSIQINLINIVPPKQQKHDFIMPVKGRISSKFGRRNNGWHTGVDIAAIKGTPILASHCGEVIGAGRMGQYGNIITLRYSRQIVTRYAHCSKLLVKKGDIVNQGDVIALVGNTGKSTGPHLHFEIKKNNKYLNPLHYVNNQKNISSNSVSLVDSSGHGCQSLYSHF